MKTQFSFTLSLTAFAAAAFTVFLVSPEVGGPVLFFGGLAAIFLHDYARTRRTLPVQGASIVPMTPPTEEQYKLAA